MYESHTILMKGGAVVYTDYMYNTYTYVCSEEVEQDGRDQAVKDEDSAGSGSNGGVENGAKLEVKKKTVEGAEGELDNGISKKEEKDDGPRYAPHPHTHTHTGVSYDSESAMHTFLHLQDD